MGRRGFALVVVLWGLLLAGTLALSLSSAMRTEGEAARNAADSGRAYYFARSGINRAVALFSSLPPEEALGRGLSDVTEGEGYEVSVEDEGGKIDVNAASAGWIRGALESAGVGAAEAAGVAAAIVEWRSPEGSEGDGAPAAPRGADGGEERPRRGKIASLDELRHVRGVTPGLYRRVLSRLFTVHGSAVVNVNAASPAVLRAAGLTAAQAERVVSLRAESPFRAPQLLVSLLVSEGAAPDAIRRLSASTPSRVFTLRARGTAGGAVRTILCRIDAGGAGRGTARILRWEDLAAGEEAS
jgi:general secretion pathway protein K